MKKKNIKFEDIPFDKNEIEQNKLDIENKERSNLFTWNGQFSPQFVEVILKKYAKENNNILDPFLGSGTVVYEAALRNLNAYGVELNTSAYLISSLYKFINVNYEKRKFEIDKIEYKLNGEFGLEEIDVDIISSKLKDILSSAEDIYEEDIVRGFIVLLDLYNKKIDTEILFKKWKQFKDTIINFPYNDKRIVIMNNDSRKIPIDDNNIDLVLTSPPYINVYNYHQQYRKSVELLGYNVLEKAKSEVGSNRKFRSNRFFTVVQYSKDICLILNELVRVCKNRARIIFVVGRESNVRGVSFYNSRIVYRLATEVLGLEFVLKQERVFKNRYGQMIYEDILHIINNKKSIGKNRDELIELSGKIAVEELVKARKTVKDNIILEEIESAITNVEQINISPIALL